MKWPIDSVLTWQTLRALARNKNKPLVGRALRLDRSRRTQDGTFLDDLVSRGLLEAVAIRPAEGPKFAHSAPAPQQFRTLYRLTANGLHAAEYGEYERPDPAPPLPVRDAAPAKAGR